MDIAISLFQFASMFQQTFSISMDIAISPFELASVSTDILSINNIQHKVPQRLIET